MCSVAAQTMKKKPSGKVTLGMRKKTPKLGQHFLTGAWAARKLIEAVCVREGEIILEIGPGKGALTHELLATGAPVVAIEKDELLAHELRSTFAPELDAGVLDLVVGDVRDFDPRAHGLKRYVLAANIPYYITGEIVRQFLTADVQPRALALLIQKEVAQRILAGDKKESILSISVKAYGKPKIISYVSKGNFSPPPSVDSAILLVDDVSKDFFAELGEEHFFTVVKTGFASKRKLLLSNLAKRFEKDSVARAATAAGIESNARAEDVSLEQWRSLAKKLV